MTNTHPSDDTIELFAMNRLPEPELGAFEEHLLVCSHCQQQVARTDQLLTGLRVALRRLDSQQRQPWPALAVIPPKVAWAAAAAALLLLIFFVVPHSSNPPQTVALVAMRGDAAAAAKPNVSLALQLDATGLAPAASNRVELVNSAGRVVASRVARASDSTISVAFDGQAAGQYWIRVYVADTLAREYSLVVK